MIRHAKGPECTASSRTRTHACAQNHRSHASVSTCIQFKGIVHREERPPHLSRSNEDCICFRCASCCLQRVDCLRQCAAGPGWLPGVHPPVQGGLHRAEVRQHRRRLWPQLRPARRRPRPRECASVTSRAPCIAELPCSLKTKRHFEPSLYCVCFVNRHLPRPAARSPASRSAGRTSSAGASHV